MRNIKYKLRSILLLLATIFCAKFVLAQNMEGVKVQNMSHYFGTFTRNQGVKVHEFELENTGADALIINRVKSTCGCTVAEWTRTPILPGKKGTVKVQFDPKKYSGYFSKSVEVYTNRSTNAINLQVSGRVQVNNKISDDFVCFVGDLKADKKEIEFGIAEADMLELKQEVRFINVMRDTISLNVKSLPSAFKLEQTNTVLAPGENSKLTISCNPSLIKEWGTLNGKMKLEIKRGAKTEIIDFPIKLARMDAFSKLSKEQREKAAKLVCSNSDSLKLDATSKLNTVKIALDNAGASDLLIRSIELEGNDIKVKKYDKQIAPGKTGYLILNYSNTINKQLKQNLVIWSNSPSNYRLSIPIEVKH